jgi:hypothetical protein
MSWLTTGTYRNRHAGRTAGCRGGCAPGTGCGSPEPAVDRASDEDIVALLAGCCSARDRLIVLSVYRVTCRAGYT